MTSLWRTRLGNRAGRWLADAGFPGAFLLFFIVLLLLNLSWVWNPPHWDEILGLHNQAVFLAKHHFSFAELWAEGQHSFEGSNVYRFGILPVAYGVLYRFLPPQTVHLIGHLFNMACIAGAGTILFQILKRSGVSPKISLLWTFAAFSEPLIAGRIAALGQECALVFCTMAVLWFAFRRNWYGALGVLVLAGFVKPSAVILSLAFLLYLGSRMVFDRSRRGTLFLPLALGIACFLLHYWMLQHNVDVSGGGVHAPGMPVRDGRGSLALFLLRKFYYHYGLYFPVLFSVILFGTAVFFRNLLSDRRHPAEGAAATGEGAAEENGKKIGEGIAENSTEKRFFALFVLLIVFGFVGAYLIAKIALPRYLAAASLPATLFLAWNLRRFRGGMAVILMIAGLFGPLFYAELPFGLRRSGEYLERSREYLRDIAANRRLCEFLEEYRECPIVVSWPLAQMLTMPEMGYVKKPFPRVYSGRVPFYAPVLRRPAETGTMPADTVYVYQEHDFEKTGMSGASLLPDRGCVALYRDSTLGGLVIVYRRAP